MQITLTDNGFRDWAEAYPDAADHLERTILREAAQQTAIQALVSTFIKALYPSTIESLLCALDEAPEDLQEVLSAAYARRYPDEAATLFVGPSVADGKYNRRHPVRRAEPLRY